MSNKFVARMAVAALGSLLACLGLADAHGYMVTPASRNMLANGRYNYYSSTGNGLGFQPAGSGALPGVCGDPFQAQSTNYAANAGSIQGTYTQGQTIEISVDLNVNHGGRFGFSVCPRNSNLDQNCFNQNKMQREDGGGQYYYILKGHWDQQSVSDPEKFTVSYRLPSDVSCPNGCVLQWQYKTFNTCVDPCDRAVCGYYADRMNYIIPESGPKSYCSASLVGEVFQNCADIRINDSDTGGTTPSGGNKCDKCSVPVSSGGCKCDGNCNCLAGTVNKCDKCNVPVTSGGCKCDGNCDCLAVSVNKCDKCNVPVTSGGCKCNSNCDCT